MVTDMLKVLALSALFMTVAGQNLFGILENRGTKIWTDAGMCCGVETDFSAYIPELPTDSELAWKIVGQRPQDNHDPAPSSEILIVASVSSTTQALAVPNGFEWIWDDRWSTAFNDGSVWHPLCPQGYTSVGDFFYNENRIEDPSGLYLDHACVREDLTVNCDFEQDPLWTDNDSSALYDCSVWTIDHDFEDAAFTDFLWAHDNHLFPPPRSAKCLNETEIQYL